MRISDVTDEIIKDHCGISGSDSDGLIAVYRKAAAADICGYTGLSEEQLDEYEDITYAFLVIIAEMFSVREMTVEIDKITALTFLTV